MWARVIEVMLGLWLAIGPLLFGPSAGWGGHLLCALAVSTFALVSFWRPLRHAHLLTLGVASWLLVAGYLAEPPDKGAAQNQIILGLLLLMFAIIPSDSSRPPEPWWGLLDRPN